MRTKFDFYENIYNDSKIDYTTFQLKLTQVCNGFKIYKKLLPDLSTRTWRIYRSNTVCPLKIEYRRGL